MKNLNERKFISIQAKISPEAAARLEEIVIKYGFKSRYEIMQCLLEAFLRYADLGYSERKNTKLSEIYELQRIWEGIENRKNRIITVSPNQRKTLKLAGSVMLFCEEGSNRHCCRYISFKGDDTFVTSNNDTILKTVIHTLFPSLYRSLSQIGKNIGCTRIDDTLEYLVCESSPQIKDTIANDIRREFESNETYEVPRYGEVTKTTIERTIDSVFPDSDTTSVASEQEELFTRECPSIEESNLTE